LLTDHVRAEPLKDCNILLLSHSEKLLFAAEALLACAWQHQVNLQLFDPVLINEDRV